MMGSFRVFGLFLFLFIFFSSVTLLDKTVASVPEI